jgi:hypothetical protein
VSFGSSYNVLKNKLSSLYGTPDKTSNKTEINYTRKAVEGFTFDNLTFEVQYDSKGKSYFSGAMFFSVYDNVDAAIKNRDLLAEKMRSKYEIINILDDNEYIRYYGGKSPVDSEQNAFTIFIVKTANNAYALCLGYGKFNYC